MSYIIYSAGHDTWVDRTDHEGHSPCVTDNNLTAKHFPTAGDALNYAVLRGFDTVENALQILEWRD